MARTVPSNTLIIDQVDVYFPADSFLRVPGINAASVIVTGFRDNTPLSWGVLDGTSVQNATISSGSYYFHEIFGMPGFYSFRFYPNLPGFWRLVVNFNGIEIVREYDIVQNVNLVQSGGLSVSF